MVKACSAKVAKFILFTVNFIFWLIGLALIGIGIWAVVDPSFNSTWNSLSPVLAGTIPNISAISYIIIGLGVVIFIFAFSGCCGAIKESKCLLVVYLILVGIVMAVEIAAIVLAIVFNNQLETQLKSSLYTQVLANVRLNYTSSDQVQNAFTIFMLETQYNAKCCGVNGWQDYFNNSQYLKDRDASCNSLNPLCSVCSVPITCCIRDDTGNWTNPGVIATNQVSCCNRGSVTDVVDARNSIGCFDTVKSVFQNRLMVIGIACIAFLVFQVILLASTIGLICAIGEPETRYY